MLSPKSQGQGVCESYELFEITDIRPSAANKTMMNLMNTEKAPISLVSTSIVKISVCDPIDMAFM